MIEIKRDNEGNIIAVCEWLLVNDKGIVHEEGKHLLIIELEINKDYRGNGVVKWFISKILSINPNATTVFFWRGRKYEGTGPRIYRREQIQRRGKWEIG